MDLKIGQLMKTDSERISALEDDVHNLKSVMGSMEIALMQIAQALGQHDSQFNQIGFVVMANIGEMKQHLEKVENKLGRVSMAVTAIRGGADDGSEPLRFDEGEDGGEGQATGTGTGRSESPDEPTDQVGEPVGGTVGDTGDVPSSEVAGG